MARHAYEDAGLHCDSVIAPELVLRADSYFLPASVACKLPCMKQTTTYFCVPGYVLTCLQKRYGDCSIYALPLVLYVSSLS